MAEPVRRRSVQFRRAPLESSNSFALSLVCVGAWQKTASICQSLNQREPPLFYAQLLKCRPVAEMPSCQNAQLPI